jgi:1-acylglycerone phosphate reductase
MAKVVLITGCSRGGIGYELCHAFHLKGHKVFATARDLRKLDGLPDDVGRLQMDVTSASSVDTAVQVQLHNAQLTGDVETH